MPRTSRILVPLAAVLFVVPILRAAPAERAVDFSRDVRPILSDHCLRCHGPDATKRQADLRLDVPDGLFEAADRRILHPGHPETSALIKRVRARDPEVRMPPPDAKSDLTAEEIALLETWVRQGAVWSEHWAFAAPRRPALPLIRRSAWPRTAVDHFILRRLEAEGLTPSPEADRATLLRRLTFDLTGLPPTPAEVEAFRDDDHPAAYERLVDRLLESPRFGERMALEWMDAGRYGDSSVYHADGVRDMWAWRDWTIESYNRNLPFDRFTIEQLAGDLVPEATRAQKIASGFHRNHGTTDEGGVIPEEYRVEYIVDRVKTTASVWLGLTMECGQCHDHKFDPISQKEYYQFFAYFNQAADAGMQTRNGNAPPFVTVLEEDDEALLARWRAEADALREELARRRPPGEEVEAWIARRRAEGVAPPRLGPWHSVGPFQGAAEKEAFEREFGPEHAPRLDATYGDKSWRVEEWKDGEVIPLGLPGNAAVYVAREIESEGSRDLAISLGSDDGIQVWHDGRRLLASDVFRVAAPDQENLTLSLRPGTQILLIKVSNLTGGSGFYFKALGDGLPDDVRELLAPDGEVPPEGKRRLADYYATNVWPPGREIRDRVRALEGREKELIASRPTSMILSDLPAGRQTFVLERGQYHSPREDEPVEPGVPAVLPPLPDNAPPNRLGLARWLVDPEHPLTARVAVNRLWQLVFGTGIVETPGDFGTRGAFPSHPELLDWLAREFVESGWDVKHMLRQILLSATYRQSSRVTPELQARDAQNRLLARAPRQRLQGEFIRDQALAVSGLLVGTIGGPSVKPYQPPGIWNEVSLDGNLRYQRDDGRKLYRRGMYIYWKRSAPSPSMRAFDAPTREMCVLRRQQTNTPLQALVTLNDVQFVEAARVFAERILRDGGPDFRSRLDFAFLATTARPADGIREEVLATLYEEQLETFRRAPERAEQLLAVGESPAPSDLDAAEHAAWTLVASVILNLDEVLTKE